MLSPRDYSLIYALHLPYAFYDHSCQKGEQKFTAKAHAALTAPSFDAKAFYADVRKRWLKDMKKVFASDIRDDMRWMTNGGDIILETMEWVREGVEESKTLDDQVWDPVTDLAINVNDVIVEARASV